MFTTLSFAALLAASGINAAVMPLKPRSATPAGLHLKRGTPKAFAKATPDSPTTRYATLKRNGNGAVRSSSILRSLAVKDDNGTTSSSDNSPLENAGGVEYLVSIKFGDQDLNVILDTGSSDTWAVSSDFTCVDVNGEQQDQSQCNFGPLFQGDFGSDKIDDVNFNITYGDGEFVTGNMGYQDVTIAGVTVTKQEVSIAAAQCLRS
jgi:hypothetical protein